MTERVVQNYKRHPAHGGGTYTAHGDAWIEHGARIGQDAWIEQDAVIAHGARIGQDARIGPGAWIGPGARIGPHTRGLATGQVLRYTAVAYWRAGEVYCRIGCVEGSLDEVRRNVARHCREHEPGMAADYVHAARAWLDYAEQVVGRREPQEGSC